MYLNLFQTSYNYTCLSIRPTTYDDYTANGKLKALASINPGVYLIVDKIELKIVHWEFWENHIYLIACLTEVQARFYLSKPNTNVQIEVHWTKMDWIERTYINLRIESSITQLVKWWSQQNFPLTRNIPVGSMYNTSTSFQYSRALICKMVFPLLVPFPRYALLLRLLWWIK